MFRTFSFIGMMTLATLLQTASGWAAELDSRVYEMRIYYAAEGKLDALHARFRDHTTKLFEKHGMTNIGYWTPIENPDRKLYYVLAYPSREAREKSWASFVADPEWQAAYKASEVDGKLVDRADVLFCQATDYSPIIQASVAEPRIFELRTYTTTPGNLDALDARFRNHTIKLFEKHGMTNVAYWHLMSDQKNAENTLVYILAHESPEAASQSFAAFRQDPEWMAARKASEEKAGGSLTTPDGVQSLMMQATDYSPTR